MGPLEDADEGSGIDRWRDRSPSRDAVTAALHLLAQAAGTPGPHDGRKLVIVLVQVGLGPRTSEYRDLPVDAGDDKNVVGEIKGPRLVLHTPVKQKRCVTGERELELT